MCLHGASACLSVALTDGRWAGGCATDCNPASTKADADVGSLSVSAFQTNADISKISLIMENGIMHSSNNILKRKILAFQLIADTFGGAVAYAQCCKTDNCNEKLPLPRHCHVPEKNDASLFFAN